MAAVQNALRLISKLPARRRWVLIATSAVAAIGLVVVVLGVRFFPLSKRVPAIDVEPKLTQLTANPSASPIVSFSLSPDGTRLIWSDSSGIHLRDIRSGGDQILPGTAGLQAVDWLDGGDHYLAVQVTSDWRWEYKIVTRNGEIRKQTVPGFRSPDGRFVARSDVRGVLSIEPTAGGNVIKVAESVQCFSWSPDSKRLVYSVFGRGDRTHSLEIVSTDGRQRHRLTHGTTAIPGAAWITDSEIAYLEFVPPRGSSLRAIGVDRRTDAASGPARSLAHWPDRLFWGLEARAQGKRLAFMESKLQAEVYLAKLEANGTRLGKPRRLTLDESDDVPYDFMRDSRSLLLVSDRNGRRGLFRLWVEDQRVEPLVTGPDDVLVARVAPDGRSILYITFSGSGQDQLYRLMRISIDGGAPVQVLESRVPISVKCSVGENPSQGACLLRKGAGGGYSYHRLDPMKGLGELVGEGVHSGLSFSPDGKFLADVAEVGGKSLRIIDSQSKSTRELRVPEATFLMNLDWAHDGRALYLGDLGPDEQRLLRVELNGKMRVLFRMEAAAGLGAGLWAIPSPDGNWLALRIDTNSGNAWMVELP